MSKHEAIRVRHDPVRVGREKYRRGVSRSELTRMRPGKYIIETLDTKDLTTKYGHQLTSIEGIILEVLHEPNNQSHQPGELVYWLYSKPKMPSGDYLNAMSQCRERSPNFITDFERALDSTPIQVNLDIITLPNRPVDNVSLEMAMTWMPDDPRWPIITTSGGFLVDGLARYHARKALGLGSIPVKYVQA